MTAIAQGVASTAQYANGNSGMNINFDAAQFEKDRARQELADLSLDTGFAFPPGKMGELASYFYYSSLKQIPVFAVCEALAFTAGIFGKAYNTPGKPTGLNIYQMVLAESGAGKGALSKGPESLAIHLERKYHVPNATKFICTRKFSHANSMIHELAENNSFTQCLSEFGQTFKAMMNGKSPADVSVRTQMLDVFDKSGMFDRVGGLRYTDNTKTVDIPHAVAYSFLGESVPEPFFSNVDIDTLTDGFMSRFLVLSYTGEVPYDNESALWCPSDELGGHLAAAVMGVQALLGRCETPVQVQWHGDIEDWGVSHSRQCTDNLNRAKDPLERSLWTRAHLKIVKLASLCAVMDDPSFPVICKEHFEWAKEFYEYHMETLRGASSNGQISGTVDEGSIIQRVCMDFLNVGAGTYAKSTLHNKAEAVAKMRNKQVVPVAYIKARLEQMAPFSGMNNRTQEINKAIQDAIANGNLTSEIGIEVKKEIGFTGKMVKPV